MPGNQFSLSAILKDLFPSPFNGAMNAICWSRTLTGDFAEMVNKVALHENITVIDPEALRALELIVRRHYQLK